jgi:glycerol-3-phosphate responsive antiterminator
MNGDDIKDTKDYDDFLKTVFSFAVVIRGDVAQIQALKQYLLDHGITVVFQKTSTNKIYITEGGT